jgi:hypothetical protein
LTRSSVYYDELRIGDVACSVNVLKEPDLKSTNKSTCISLYDPKDPGMDIDQCTGNLGQQCNAAMIHISLSREHKEMASISVDTSLKNVSKMSYSTLQDCGVLVNSRREMREIMPGCTEFQRKCGKTCYLHCQSRNCLFSSSESLATGLIPPSCLCNLRFEGALVWESIYDLRFF